MGGLPDFIEVSKLEVVYTGNDFGEQMKDIIQLGTPRPAGETRDFDLIVEFVVDLPGMWWSTAEGISDMGPAIPAEVYFYAETIGPGDDIEIGNESIDLTVGGDPGTTDTSKSLYHVRHHVADAELVFLDSGGSFQPGLYRLGCWVKVYWNVGGGIINDADAYFGQDLVVRVVERT